MKKFDFIGFSALNIDYYYKNNSNKPIGKFGGGGGANTICGLSRLGFNCGLVGILGKDEDGVFLKNDLDRWLVDTSTLLQRTGHFTGKTKIIVGKEGQRKISYSTGINKEIERRDINEKYLLSTNIIHFSSFLTEKQLNLQTHLIRSLHNKLKISLLLDEHYASFGYKKLRPFLKYVDFLFAKKDVIQELTNLDYEEAASKLLSDGCEIVSVIKSPHKSYFANDSQQLHLENARFRVVDSTGYSSAYATGFLCGLNQGKALKDCAQLANAAMLFCSTRLGVKSNLPDRLELITKAVAAKERKKVLIVGGGGREFTLGWKLAQEKDVSAIYTAPGNAGTLSFGINVNIGSEDIDRLVDFVKSKDIDFTIVGPEMPLTAGIVDRFIQEGLAIFGPLKKAAELEGSKVFAKRFLKKFKIPSADFKVFKHYQKALIYIRKSPYPLVVKADGLAAGKGVFVCQTQQEAKEALKKIMVKKVFGEAGNHVVIEEYLFGEEASILAFTDGQTIVPMVPVQDHKPVFDGDQGPNTGGMGCYAPALIVSPELMADVVKNILIPTIKGLKKMGRQYKGVLYTGLMITKEGPKVLEYNCRFGDPETQVILPLLKGNLLKILFACADRSLEKEKIHWQDGSCVCVVLASGGYPEKYQKGYPIEGLNEETDHKGLLIIHAGTALKTITSSGRVLGITAVAPTIGEARKKAYDRISKLSFKNMHYRTDIGAKALTHLKKANRIEVRYQAQDARAKVLKKHLEAIGFKGKIENISLVDVYTIDKGLKKKSLKKIASMLANPIIQEVTINKSEAPGKFSWAIEIGFLPGVTDNVANTVKNSIEDLLKLKLSSKEGIYTSQIIFLQGKLSKEDVVMLTNNLINPLVQRASIKNAAQFQKDKGMDKVAPQVRLDKKITVARVDLRVNDEELMTIGKQGIADKDGTRRGPLALDLTYMKAIQEYFKKQKRKPTDIELESIAQTWSEHCKHTIFADPIDEIKKGLYKTFIKGATEKINSDICVSVFTDNSGAIVFDKDWLITDKVETHNSPSVLDPFGGSITGIVGVNRDTIGFGLGAKPIINRYGFCFADPQNKSFLYKNSNLTQKILSARRIMEGVIKGVNVGGNCSGIPTPQGFIFFDKSYRGKPLVFVGTVGLIPRKKGKRVLHKKKARKGDCIVMIGGRVGLDGIHGATFSSEAMDTGSPVSAVQIGDPITQKKLSDVTVKEARDLGLYNSITDNGAGGLSCSVAEMAQECGGCEVELDKVPLKYPGLAPWQIWISESQERMTLAVPASKWEKFTDLMERRGVEATVIGKFTNSGKCVVKHKGKKIMDLDMDFLHNGLPLRPMKTIYTQKHLPEPKIPVLKDWTRTLKMMLKRPNIASFAFISQQYDHEVQGGSVIKPLQGRGRVNGDATVIKPVLSSKKGVVVSQGINPEYGQIDTYHMAACAIDTAIRNAIAVGADLNHLALLDNFCWCSSDEPERLGQLKRAVQACYDYAVAYKTPFISGKDSMFNDFKGFNEKGEKVKISVLPTLLISSLGIIKDINKTVSIDTKFPGDLVYVLGETFEELGGSEYYTSFQVIGNQVPQVNAKKNKKLYQALTRCIKKELISSSISVTRGGLGIALAKMAMAGDLGLNLSLKNLSGKFSRSDYALFSESQGRIIVTIDPKNKEQFETIMKSNVFSQIGKVTKNKAIVIKNRKGKIIINLDSKLALKNYKSTFKNY